MTMTPDATLARGTAPVLPAARWFDICAYGDLLPERGACAMVDGVQVAIFRTHGGELFALSNFDPYSDAYVISRGILGTRGGSPTVASPMYKQVFDLHTGVCLDEPQVALPTFRVRRTGSDRVEVAVEVVSSDEHRQ